MLIKYPAGTNWPGKSEKTTDSGDWPTSYYDHVSDDDGNTALSVIDSI